MIADRLSGRKPGRGLAGCLAIVVLVAFTGVPALSQEGGEPNREAVERALARFEQALQDEPGLRAETKDALRNLLEVLHEDRPPSAAPSGGPVSDEQVAEAVDAYLKANPPEPRERKWDKFLEAIDVYGDFRFRHESIMSRHKRSDRHRERIRFRLGFTYPLDEEWSVAARVITGNPDDPQSPHQDLGSGFNSWEVSLDRVYVEYRPQRFPGLWFKGGKFEHIFKANPTYGNLVFDEDVQPEGVAMGMSWDDVGGIDRADFAIGQYIVIEQDNLDEASAFVVQVSATETLTDNLQVFGALGWYRYTDVTPDDNPVLFLENSGNAVWLGEYVSRFSIVNPILALTYTGLDQPFTVSAEWIHNIRAANGEGKGWSAGLAYGKNKQAKDYRLYYTYAEIEQDAVLSTFSQDDFTRSTNFRGHLAGVQYMFTDDVGVNVWGLFSEQRMPTNFLTNDDDHNEWKFRVDLNIKF